MNNKLTLISSLLTLSISALPAANAQWVRTSGPYHGFIRTLATSGTNTSSPMLFAGTSDGVYLSTNNGSSWTAANSGLTNAGVTSLALTGENTSSPMLFAGTNAGVYRTSNSGKNWTAVNKGISDLGILAIAASGANTTSPMLFAGSQRGRVYLSSDMGDHWTTVDSALPHGVNVLVVDERSSINGGSASPPTIFAGTGGLGKGGLGKGGGVFISTNKGATWSVSNNGILEGCINSLGVINTGRAAPMEFVGTLQGAFISTDKGASWNEANKGLKTGTEIRAFAASGNNIFVGTSDGVYHTTDNGTNWEEANDGFNAIAQIYGLAVIGTNLFAATNDGVWKKPR